MNTQDRVIVQSGVQSTFFGKVMFAFSLGILVSALGVYAGIYYFNQFFFTNPLLMWVLFGVELVLIFTSGKWSTKRPLNYALFSAFTFITGLTIAPLISAVIVQMQSPDLVVKALAVTGLMFTASGLIGWTTQRSLQGLGGFLMMGLIGMIIVAVVGFFLPWGSTGEMIFSGIGVLLFSAFAMYDFQMIKKYPEDRYIDAAIALYLDIFNLFLYVLRLLMAINRND